MKILRRLTELQHQRGHLDDATLRELARELNVPLYRLEGLVSFYPAFRRTPTPQSEVHVCRDVVCLMRRDAQSDARQSQLVAAAEVTEVSCLGRCDCAPAAMVDHEPTSPLTLHDDWSDMAEPPVETRTFQCDPYKNGTPYQSVQSLASSIVSLREKCVQELTASGLRGMGGAGFPTGRKWELVAAEPVAPKYVICNADESEPGTFKDRVILEQLPHLVLEGMVLAGLSIGAESGIVYLRHEYTRERRILERAIHRARELGVLGDNAAGSGKRFDVEIFVSPGGYILGEETALLEALEDKRGEPRNKPPYPGTHGLWGKPTLINNVESFAMATSIVSHDADWWKAQGVSSHAGLKFVCISGDVENPGVWEVPMGTSVDSLIELAGGMKEGRPLKAFLPGGASSNFLTARHADTPMDFDAMRDVGSMMGTGALIVMAEGRDLFALATNLVKFFRNESCGKCVPCRVGSEKAVGLLEAASAESSAANELQLLPELGDTLEQTSICGLGQVALNPILSMMQHFPEEIPS